MSGGLDALLGTGGIQVVVGATDPLGMTLTNQLASAGRNVRAVCTEGSPRSGVFRSGVEVLEVNAFEASKAIEACKGARVVYDCYEPVGSNRKKTLAEVTSNFLLGAIESAAIFVMASHLRNSPEDNDSVEKDVLNAHFGNLTKTAVVRLPQLYGPGVVNQLWKNVFGSAVSGKRAHWVGDPGIKRSYLFVDDAARAMEAVAGEPSALGRHWSVAGPGPMSGREVLEMAFKAAKIEPDIGVWGRGVMLTGWLLAPQAKEFLKLPYDYYAPFALDGSEFVSKFSSWSYTPPEEAFAKTLEWYKAAVA